MIEWGMALSDFLNKDAFAAGVMDAPDVQMRQIYNKIALGGLAGQLSAQEQRRLAVRQGLEMQSMQDAAKKSPNLQAVLGQAQSPDQLMQGLQGLKPMQPAKAGFQTALEGLMGAPGSRQMAQQQYQFEASKAQQQQQFEFNKLMQARQQQFTEATTGLALEKDKRAQEKLQADTLAMQKAVAANQKDPSTSVSDYYVQFGGTFENVDKTKGLGRPQAPAGFQYTPLGGVAPIPGSPQAMELGEKQRAAAQEQALQLENVQATRTNLGNLLETVGDAMQKVKAGAGGPIAGTPIGAFAMNIARMPESKSLLSSYDVIKSGLKIETIKQLKSLSKTGSTGFGSLTEKEGEDLSQAVAKLDATLPMEDQIANLNKIRKYVTKLYGTETAKGQAMKQAGQYSTVAPQGGQPSTQAPAGPSFREQQQAYEWAQSNPNDPRAAQILKRLGY